jgi:hypothetical protein
MLYIVASLSGWYWQKWNHPLFWIRCSYVARKYTGEGGKLGFSIFIFWQGRKWVHNHWRAVTSMSWTWCWWRVC